MSMISISSQDFAKLSKTAQIEILNLFKSNRAYDDEDRDGELTYKQVQEVISRLSEKSRWLLKAVVNFNKSEINLNLLLEELDTDEQDLRGAWSGITNSCRNVSGDPEFLLFSKTWNEDEEAYILKFHPTTYVHISSFFQ